MPNTKDHFLIILIKKDKRTNDWLLQIDAAVSFVTKISGMNDIEWEYQARKSFDIT